MGIFLLDWEYKNCVTEGQQIFVHMEYTGVCHNLSYLNTQ